MEIQHRGGIVQRLTPPAVRVWIDDRHAIFRRGLVVSLVAEGIQVAGESSHFRPEPRLGGVHALLFDADLGTLRTALRLADKVRLLALFREVDEELMWAAFDGGVSAIMLHDDLDPRTLASTLKNVSCGNASIPKTLVSQLIERASRAPRNPSRARLTPREMDVLRLLGDGEDTRGIAHELAYSERTVKNLVHDVLVKMNCRNRAHAVATAARQGII